MRTTEHIVRGLAIDGRRKIEYGRRQIEDGQRQIEDSVLLLLDANPQGLRNVDIAESLDLHSSDANGGNQDWQTWKILKDLTDRGDVKKDGNLYKRKEE